MKPWIAALALALVGMSPLAVGAQGIKVSVPLADLEQAARTDSTDVIAQYNLAIGYWSKKRWAEVDSMLDRAIQLEPRFALAYLAKSYLPFARDRKLLEKVLDDDVPAGQLEELAESDRLYRQAFFYNPMVDLRIMGAVTPGKWYGWSAYPELASFFETWIQGFEDFRDGEYEGAYRRFDRMVERYTSVGRRTLDRVPADILWMQALAAARLGKFDVALMNGREVVARHERTERERETQTRLTYAPMRANEYRYVLGVLYAAANHPDTAIALFQETLEHDIGAYMAHVQLASLFEQRGQLRIALEQRRAALAANPEDPTSAIELAITLTKVGEGVEAEAVLAETARTNPLNPRAHYLLGILRQQLGKPVEARTALEAFLTICPSRFTQEAQDARARLASLP